MENASKALIFAASTIIAIIILSFMVYIFRRFGATARSTEKRYSAQEIQAFNSKFINYETEGSHSLDDKIAIIYYRGRKGATDSDTRYYSYREIFNRNGELRFAGDISSSKYEETYACYHKALIGASQTLNKVSDVVTAINDAIDVNDKNNNGYRYDYLEIQNSVEIIVDLGDNGTRTSDINKFNFSKIGATNQHYRYLVIEPNSYVKAKHIYGSSSITTSGTNTAQKEQNTKLNIFKSSNEISVYDMLDELRNTEIIMDDSKDYMVYQYYFFGEVFVNETTGLVETVKFTLVKDNKFGTKLSDGTHR